MTVSSQQTIVNHGHSQAITNVSSGDGPPSRRSSSNTRSPVKVIQHELENQLNQPQQQPHIPNQQQQQVQQQPESGDRESAASESTADKQEKKRKLVSN